MNLLRAAATVGSLTLLSRVLGFLRDLGIAAVLGAGVAADAFFVAFKLANMLRRLFAEGAFNAGFVPLFARTLEQEGAAAARAFAGHTFSAMALILGALVLAAELAMPLLVRLLATGFEPGSERYALAVELSRLTFPYLAAISLAALLSGVLNGLGRFAAAAFAPVLLNLVLLLALALAVLRGSSAAHLLALGVLVAGFVQLALVFLAAARAGFALVPRLPRGRERTRLRRLWQLVLPGAFGAGVYQLNLVIDTWFASHLPTGSISYLFYADRLVQLPLGLVGVALGTALLPLLARQLRAGREEAARHNFDRALELGLFASLPAAVGLVLLAEPIVRVLFERGAFGPPETTATAAALSAFALGLPAFVLVKVLATGFFAREDTRTPVAVAAVCLLANILFILLTIDHWGHVSIALATALSNWLNAGLLAAILMRRGAFAPGPQLRRKLPRLVASASLLALGLFFVRENLPAIGSPWGLAGTIALAAPAYVVFALALGAFSIAELRAALAPKPAVAGSGQAVHLDKAETA